jgi:cytochrome c oxidase subunit IV
VSEKTVKLEGKSGPQAHSPGHVMPLWLLAGVWLALMALTYATVAVTQFDLGRLNLWLALAIATVKAYLVALYFMHLRYDRPFNGLLFLGALVFVMLFVGFALMDTLSYAPEMIPGYSPGMGTP